MNKKMAITVGVTVLVMIMFGDKIKALPGISKIPTF